MKPFRQSRLLVLLLASLSTSDRGRAEPIRLAQQHQERQQKSDRHLIVGGQDADPDRYPYYVRLDYEGEAACGGTLVRRDMVLTAAHCAYDYELGIINATAGAFDFSTSEANTRLVTKIFRNPIYDQVPNMQVNDIALLQIEPFDADRPLVQINADRTRLAVGDSVVVIGLGAVSVDGKEEAEVLQEVELKVVADDVCDQRYGGYLHRKSMICATDPNQDACDGDSGGMLAIVGNTPDEDVQVGVASFGHACAHESIPGVYADVANVYGWIEKIFCEYSLDGCSTEPPTSAPSVDPIDPNCQDLLGAFFVDTVHQYQNCEWLASSGRQDSEFCVQGREAWDHCPRTCHACAHSVTTTKLPSIFILIVCVAFAILVCSAHCLWFLSRRKKKLAQGFEDDATGEQKAVSSADVRTVRTLVHPEEWNHQG